VNATELSRIGSGGEGSVYLALHIKTEQFWAVKEIRGDYPEHCHELEVIKHFSHLNLPKVIDVIASGGGICLVMEYIRGVSLDRLVRSGKLLSEEQVIDAALQTSGALLYLEKRNPPVCHLDVKPANLVRRLDGVIVLVDFGSAWEQKGTLRRLGTAGYAAPEQYGSGIPDKRSDLYGLGAVLYRLLSGKTYSQTLEGARIPNCSPALEKIVQKCLRQDKEKRYQSAGEVQEALRKLVRRRKRENMRRRTLSVFALLMPAAAFCFSVFPSPLDSAGRNKDDYDELLREARVSGENESYDLYRKAIFTRPSDPEAYLRFLEDASFDAFLSDREETFLRDMLHTVEFGAEKTNEERLRENTDGYGEVAVKTGLAYWYDSREEDARRIAAGWFEKAQGAFLERRIQDRRGKKEEGTGTERAAGSETEGTADKETGKMAKEEGAETKWEKLGRLYGAAGRALEVMERQPRQGEGVRTAYRYWESLEELLKSQEQITDPLMRLQLFRDALFHIAFLAKDLEKAGIGSDQIREASARITAEAKATEAGDAPKVLLEGLLKEIGEGKTAADRAAEDLE